MSYFGNEGDIKFRAVVAIVLFVFGVVVSILLIVGQLFGLILPNERNRH